jgi:hypothetical protein
MIFRLQTKKCCKKEIGRKTSEVTLSLNSIVYFCVSINRSIESQLTVNPNINQNILEMTKTIFKQKLCDNPEKSKTTKKKLKERKN